MSRTDKDRPYIVRLYDEMHSSSRCTTHIHRCHRPLYNRNPVIKECDYKKYTVKEVKTFNNTNKKYLPRCEDHLREHRNYKGDRDSKVLIHRMLRRGQRQHNNLLKYFDDLDPYRYDRRVWLLEKYWS